MPTNKSQDNTIILIPHFDDEFFIIPVLLLKPSVYQNPLFVFLITDPHERASESRKFLESFGYQSDIFLFVGRDLHIEDGSVALRTKEISAYLLENLGLSCATKILTPAWEGGHPDHDACFIIANLLALETEAKVTSYYTYNGFNTKWLFFRIMHPIPDSDVVVRTLVPLRLYLEILCRIRFFRSQWKTWLMFLPGLIWKLTSRRHVSLKTISIPWKLQRPHSGPLLYERYNRITFESFFKIIRSQHPDL